MHLIDLDEIGGALVVCDEAGYVVGGSPSGQTLLSRLCATSTTLPSPLSPELWQLLSVTEVGQPVQWRSPDNRELLLGCTRYRLGTDAWLLMMREISQEQSELASRLHRQRLEALGRLVATTAHDLRTPLASIVFNSDVLSTRIDDLPPERVREMVGDVSKAATRLRATIDSLLDYVRLGNPLPSEVSLRDILSRVQSLLRPHLRSGGHELVVALAEEADRVIGNPLAVEQIFVNLVLNAIEAAQKPVSVRVTSYLEHGMIRVVVEDNGPGIRSEHRLNVFDPFFTTKRDGTGIGLTAAREAARAAGGDLLLLGWNDGATFAVLLPTGSIDPSRSGPSQGGEN